MASNPRVRWLKNLQAGKNILAFTNLIQAGVKGKMKKLISIAASLLIASASLVGLSQAAHATNFLGKYFVGSYNFSGTETIHEVDPVSGVVSAPLATITMTNSGESIEALEVDGSTGTAYFSTSGGEFWKVNLSSGVSTKLVSSPAQAFNELAMNPVTGDLFGLDGAYSVWSINKTTGASVMVGARPVSHQQNLVGGNGFALNTLGEYYFSGPGASPKLEIADSALSAGMTVGSITGLSNNRSYAIYATDVTQSGDLVMYSPASNGPARIQTAAAADIANFDQIGVNGVSSTRLSFAPSTAVTLQLGSYNIDPYSFAIANGVAPSTHTVSYDANNGSGSIASTTATDPVSVSDGSGFTRSGFTLGGWNTLADGTGTAVSLSGSFSPGSNATLYAQWTAVPAAASSKYEGPLFSPIAQRSVNSVTGGKLTLEGRSISKVTKVALNGSDLNTSVTAAGGIEVIVPAGKPGSADLKITFVGGSLVWENAFQYVDPATIKPEFVYHEPKPSKPVKKPTKVKTKVKK
jgi:hypothetical protein